jgi:hypothetical protein
MFQSVGDCERFPNVRVLIAVRRGGGGFYSYVRTHEVSAWTSPCVYTWRGDCVSVSRSDALARAEAAAREAIKTGYVPAF